MNILSEIPINLKAEDILLAQYLGRKKEFPQNVLQSVEKAIDAGRSLFEPALIYDEFSVVGAEGEELILSTGGSESRLKVGPKIDLLHPAQRVIVGVNTLGLSLEKRVDELQESKDLLDAYMLDTVGVVALGEVGNELRVIAEKRAAELGWGVGAALAPGSLVGWPLTGQRQLCALLPIEMINVKLNPSCVLEPHKSASTLIGIGPGYTSSRVGSVCRFCSLAANCWRRRKDSSES